MEAVTDAAGEQAGQPLRADALRNRERILAATRAVLLDQGTAVPMEAIARRAGVGVGTLYRRFPDRDALIQAVAIDSIQHLTRSARAVWDEEPDAWSALRRVMLGGGEFIRVLAVVRPHMLPGVRDNHELLAVGQAWLDVVGRLVEAAQDEGRVRRDVGPGDIALMLNLLTRPIPGVSAEVAEVLPDRFLELMLDALRPEAASALPGGPITTWWS